MDKTTSWQNTPGPWRVVSAAMLMDDGLIITGVRHFSPDMRATMARVYGRGLKLFGYWIRKPYHLRVKEQGFIDTRGNFLSRKDAWIRADINGQIRIYHPTEEKSFPQPANTGTRDILFSENLY